MKRVVEVQLGVRSYPVTIAPGLLDDPAAIKATVTGRHALIVSNEVVAPLALERVRQALATHSLASVVLPDGEVQKSLASTDRLLTALAKMGGMTPETLIFRGKKDWAPW